MFVVCLVANLIANVYLVKPLQQYLEGRKGVKPIRGGSGDGTKVWYLCGKCCHCVDHNGVKLNFCQNCGKRVDWG